jgi:hypothetical protein
LPLPKIHRRIPIFHHAQNLRKGRFLVLLLPASLCSGGVDAPWSTAIPEIIVTQMNQPSAAMAAAAHFLARRAPFDQFGFGPMVLSLDAQIKRGSYVFAIEGQKVVGYLGWIMLDTATALRFAASGRVPDFSETEGHDVVWLLVAGAIGTPALNAMLAAGRKRYAGLRAMGVRHKPGGKKVVFDKAIRLR